MFGIGLVLKPLGLRAPFVAPLVRSVVSLAERFERFACRLASVPSGFPLAAGAEARLND